MAPVALVRTFIFGTFVLLWSTSAGAQVLGRTVVIPYGSEGGEQPGPQAVAQVESALVDRRVPLISLHEARDRFVALSRAPVQASAEEAALVKAQAAEALEHVAFGRAAEAQKTVRQVLKLADSNLESLQRDTDSARSVMDACLALVQLALQQDNRRGAVEQATLCRHYVPDVLPHEALHPARVIGVLAEADDQIRRLRTGQLRVESAPATECSVFVNGRHLGLTPFNLERAAAGEDRVQLKCGTDESRVHIVKLGDKPVELRVDMLLDQTIVTEPRLSLRYKRASDASSQVVVHAAELGKAVRADDVVLVGALNGRVELVRVHVPNARLVARSLYTPGLEAEEGPGHALDALIEGRIESAPVAANAAVETAPKEPDPQLSAAPGPAPAEALATPFEPKPTRSHARLWSGLSLVALGAGLYAAGWGLDARAHNLNAELVDASDAQHSSLQSDYDRARNLRWMGLGGAALATAAVPLLMRPRASVPWWSWSLGGAGAALVAVGIWQVAQDGKCNLHDADTGACVGREDTAARGALLLSAAAPLLAVPLTHLLKRADANATVGLELNGSRAVALLRIVR